MAQGIPFSMPRRQPVQALRDWFAAMTVTRWLALGSFAGVVTLAAVLNVWHLSQNGYGNTYYAAAVRSMTASWSNFFFGSFDPGGFITVDKPPVFLWIGGLSARIFGYSPWALLLPSAIAGTGTVALVWLILKRYFGVVAATAGGLVLALTPITVAVDRLNLPEPFLILALVGAAGACLRSLESRRWWAWTLLAGILVGVAFNTKMLAAWIPGPALVLALLVGDSSTWRICVRRVAGRLAILGVATFAVSFSWMLFVDAWPADARPYIGGSADNTVQNLIFDYNGLGRVDGNERPGSSTTGGGGGAPNRGTGGPPTGGNAGGAPAFGGGNGAGGGQPANRGNTGRTQPPANRNTPQRAATPPLGNSNGAGGIIAGTPGWLRMLDDANGPQIAWFLPFALLGSILCLWEWRRDRVKRAAVVLALGWVLLFAGVFSYAQGIYHSYYTSAMAPGIALLVGMSVMAAARLIQRSWLWILPTLGIVGATAWMQLDLAGRFPTFEGDARPVALVVLGTGVAGLIATVAYTRLRTRPLFGTAAMGFVLVGLLIIPGSWSHYEATHTSINTTLPQTGPREGAAGRSFGSAFFDNGTGQLAAWLDAHKVPGSHWDLVVSSAQNASTLIAAYHLSVMPLGGFSGSDPTITASEFADYIQDGDVRYVLLSGGIGQFGNFGLPIRGNQQPPISNTTPTNRGTSAAPSSSAAGRGARTGATTGAGPVTAQPPTAVASEARGSGAVFTAVRAACQVVTANDLPTQYRGTLYDCEGAADALRAAAVR